MQSQYILIRLIAKIQSMTNELSAKQLTYFYCIEISIIKLLRHIAKICISLLRDKGETICIPATCITMECISRILTKLVIYSAEFKNNHNDDSLIPIIGLVLCFNL